MCGLTGFARNPAQPGLEKSKEIFTDLLLSIENRGAHATGLAATGKTSNPFVWKWAEKASFVVKSDVYKETLEAISDDTEVVIGHTRHATHNNAKRDEAAHPFSDGRVVGAHNGVVYNWMKIERELGRKDMIVDSQAIFALLNACKDPVKALEYLEGYFALTWTKGKSFFIARSSDAVLHCAYVPGLHTLYWNSDQKNLLTVLDKYNVGDYTYWNTAPNTIYRYEPSKFDSKGTNVGKNLIKFSSYKRFVGKGKGNRTYAGGSYWDATNALERMDSVAVSQGKGSARRPKDRVTVTTPTSAAEQNEKVLDRMRSGGSILLSDLQREIDGLRKVVVRMTDRLAKVETILEWTGMNDEFEKFLAEAEEDDWENAGETATTVGPQLHLGFSVEPDPGDDVSPYQPESTDSTTEAEVVGPFTSEDDDWGGVGEMGTVMDGANAPKPPLSPARMQLLLRAGIDSGLCANCQKVDNTRGRLLDAPNGCKVHEKCVFEEVSIH